ncbi:MAG: DNA mismatch repair protein MutS, partial [Clostridiales Family XIII bacterium]|nr:DNA mismatch repair protein MutS [Clostridiales Family XIII bacterium]
MYTPMMQQYLEIKEQYQDCILFFRLGDFYEMFFDDALEASAALDITLTKKNCGVDNEKAPMCGVPFHSVDSYITKLVEKGYKVAICEQTEEPVFAKALVAREVIRVLTPGTLTGDSMLNAQENNYLASVYEGEGGVGLAYCDISTGELSAAAIEGKDSVNVLINELTRVGAREVILFGEDALSSLEDVIRDETDIYTSVLTESYYDVKRGERALETFFGGSSGEHLGLAETGNKVRKALYGLFSYLEETQKQQLLHINRVDIYNFTDHMVLDKASIRNLELTETLFDRQVSGSLLGVLDKTHTAMGGRLLKKWLREPLISVDAVNRRLDAVETLTDGILMRNNLREHFRSVYDLERLAGRVSCGNANGRDLIALKNSTLALTEIKGELSEMTEGCLLAELDARIDDLPDIRTLIESAITEDPPFSVREGGMIRDGYSESLDALKDSIRDGQQWIASLERKERERTGIKNLKVGYNRVFGYYIDVTNANRGLIPENYIRKQTLVNSERYITPELKEVESLVLGAEAGINRMEYDIFTEIRVKLQTYIPAIQHTSAALAALDVLTAFAEAGEKYGYVKPHVDDGDVVEIVRGRHPVIERNMNGAAFVPNDIYLDRGDRSMLLITGPNMAGKSTYMRQTALIVLMAQIGSFVPADRARIGVADRLYTRIGASDNLAKGQSTFFVEMNELAYILNTATKRSLIILDEIGRGTSTYDGLSIAWAVLEYLCAEERRVRTLFATHYHELTVLEGKLSGLTNLNTEIGESDGEIVFLHRITEGSASRSYGIHVARLAGVP